MPLLVLLLAIGIAYIALAATMRHLKARWNALGNARKLAEASLLALLSALQSFLQIALLVLGAFTLFVVLAWLVSPLLAARLLTAIHNLAAAASDGIDLVKGGLTRALLWLALAGLLWAVWRRRSEQLAGLLRAEHARQKAELAARQSDGALPRLEASREMIEVYREMAVFGDPASGQIRVPPGMTVELAAAKYKRLVERFLDLDVERRVDLTGIAVDPIDPDEAKRWWPAIRVGLFSKGVVQSLGWGGKMAGRIGTAAACLLIVGVAAPAVADKGLRPYLAHIEDLQILISRQQAEESLAALFSRRPLPPAGDEPPPEAYTRTAALFLRDIATAPDWRDPPVATEEMAVDLAAEPTGDRPSVADFALREAILSEAATTEGAEAPRLNVVSVDADSLPADAHVGYERLVERLAPGENGAERKLARLLRAASERHPRIKKAIADYYRSFHEPAAVWDYGGAAFSDLFGKAIETTFPGVPGEENPFVGKPWKAAHKSLESAAENFVRERLARFLAGLETGSVKAGRVAIEPGSGVIDHFTREERRAVGAFVERIGRERAVTEAALPAAPAVEHVPAPDERAFVGRMRTLLGAQGPDQALSILGGYDDIFPGRVSSRGTTAFQQSFANGGAETRSQLAVVTARDWPRLDSDPHVGGVLIGLVPPGDARYRDLVWRRTGDRFELALVDMGGNRQDLGTFGAAVVQQAIAYAADGRLTAVTITAGSGLQRVQLHPVLEDTPLGCDIISLDELVFDETGHNPQWTAWITRVQRQGEIYNLALVASRDGKAPGSFPTPATFEGWRARDPQTSVLAHYGDAFDPDVVAAIASCQGEAGRGPKAFWDCFWNSRTRSYALETRIGFRSGVREMPYGLTDGSAFRGPGMGGTWPFHFKYLAVIEGRADALEPAEPWSFPPLGDLAQRSVEALAARDPQTRSLLGRIERFTVVQRIASLALRGQLGASFPKTRILDLMRAAKAAGPVPRARTPLWGGSASQLRKSIEDYAQSSRDDLKYLNSLRSAVARDAPEKAANLDVCIAVLQHPASSAARDAARICPELLAPYGFPYGMALANAAAPAAIPAVLDEYADRLRDTGQCRARGRASS
ncbi:MAG: hypothetical protein ACJ8ER_05370 [Allosphingosinicella sp.]